jgi:hypothetical protein
MTRIRFSTICDVDGCEERSEVYSTWPSCTECGEEVCSKHQEKGTLNEEENECICLRCAEENA